MNESRLRRLRDRSTGAATLINEGMTVIRKYISSMVDIYNLADFYVFPVLRQDGAIETPLSVMEAMACNLPIVSVPVGDVPEVIGSTDGCYLCTQEPQDVAAKLEMALNRGKRTNGREKIADMEIGATSREIITVYQQLINNKKRSWWNINRLWRRSKPANARKRQH